jgi:uncharacterized protein YndB with AHSA1/START domain
MIHVLARSALVGLVIGWIVDQWLERRAAGGPPPAIASLIVIDAPIERVWRVVADIEGQPRWMHEMQTVRLLTPPPVGVGTRGEATVRIMGIGVADPVEVTAFAPPTTFAVRHDGRFTGGGVITLERGADGSTTIVRWDETLVAPILPHAWSRLAAPVLRSIFQADLRHLAALVEGGDTTPATGASASSPGGAGSSGRPTVAV